MSELPRAHRDPVTDAGERGDHPRVPRVCNVRASCLHVVTKPQLVPGAGMRPSAVGAALPRAGVGLRVCDDTARATPLRVASQHPAAALARAVG